MKLYVSNDFATGTNCVNIAINLTVSDEPAYYDPPKDPLDMQIKLLAMGEKFQSLVCLYLMCGLDMDNAATAAMGVVNMERTWALLGDSPLHYTEREYGACAKDTRSLTLDELAAYCPHFPLKETLKKFGKDQSERYVCTAPLWLTALDGVWTEENLNSLRELIMAKVMLECSPYIDRSAYSQALAALGTPAETPEANAWAVCSDPGTFGQLIARLYAMTSDMMSATTLAVIDTHPAQYLRVNVNAQMMDEFHETYGVKEGNNMYVAPESRLRIWGAD